MNKSLITLNKDTIIEEHPNRLLDQGVFYLAGDLKKSISKDVVTWILESNLKKKKIYDHLTLIMTSDGGEVSAAFAIIDTIRDSNIPIHTIGLGMVGSAALYTFIAGHKRILTPNTSILSHQWDWEISGNYNEVNASMKEYELTQQRVIDHYKKFTKLSTAMILEKLLPTHDVWLSAEEAVKYGLCDEIKMLQ